MRLGLLTQWFDPEPGPAALPGVLARGLAHRGHEVHVLTGFPNYPTGRLAAGYRLRARTQEIADGVRITRTTLYPSHDASTLRRMLNYGSFGLTSAALGGPALRGLDALWVNYSPITVAPAMWRARHAHGVPLVVHVGDLWPDTLWAGGFAPDQRLRRHVSTAGPPRAHPPRRGVDTVRGMAGAALAVAAPRIGAVTRAGLQAWCDAMYADAAVVSYISPGVEPVLRGRGVPPQRLEYAPMWADEATFAPADAATRDAGRAWRTQIGVGEQDVLLLYAGALGHAQGLHTLVRAAAQAAGAGAHRLRVVIAGSGGAENELAALARETGDGDAGDPVVRLVGRVDQSRMPALMAAADACYIGLAADPLSRITMPSKTQATMAAGRPIVVCADGDVAQVVTDARAGWATGSADVPGLSRILVRLCESDANERRARGRAGRLYYERMFAVDRAVERVERHLTQAARS